MPNVRMILVCTLLAGVLAGCGTNAPGALDTPTTVAAPTAVATDTLAPAATALPATDTLPPAPTMAPRPVATATPAPPPTDTALPPLPPTVTPPAAPPPAPRQTTPTPGAANGDQVLLTNHDSNHTVTLKVGQVLSLQLRDRQWSAPVVDQTLLQVVPLNVMLPQGLSRWDYRAIAPGQTTLTTEGACPPNPNGPTCMSILLYKVTIVVTP
ncbi:MAG TPA: hypothetical protein VKY74_24835 [Chloroflexia bacterium]|nr:hypothetical protein [Chloroflexia bacterium]